MERLQMERTRFGHKGVVDALATVPTWLVQVGSWSASWSHAVTHAADLEDHTLYAKVNSLYVAPGHPWYGRAERDPGLEALSRGALVVDPYWGALPHSAIAAMATGGTLADSVEGVALLVCSGSHAGLLPDHLVASTPALQALRRVCPERYSYGQDIALTCRRGKVAPAVREFLRCLPTRR